MIVLKMDVKSALKMVWSLTAAQIIANGERYVKYELQRPETERVKDPPLDMVQRILSEAIEFQNLSFSGESSRAEASGTFKSLLAEAKVNLKLGLKMLHVAYHENLAMLEFWGFNFVSRRNHPCIRLPRTTSEWLELLRRYVEQEAKLPETERIKKPDFTLMSDIHVAIQKTHTDREKGKYAREIGNQELHGKARALLEVLQVAALVLMVTRLDRKITPELRNWGFNVVAATPKKPEESPKSVEEPHEAESNAGLEHGNNAGPVN